ncbi:sensor histidine kinase [Christiangramia sediminis]|uniref:Histidine kinase n=1 Tax=Christiangramia sediminis TaxID=2881336 RepID=A0A9X1LG15_9FLAO|nr:histidine kinase [Christiangramia sediminis]MCB7479700.1 histidine kinase [Christiangramia sediminis]
MPFYKTIRFFLFSLLWFNVAFSQNFPGKNYTAANELPNNAVRSLLVDSNNILWIGTDNGVVKKENDVFKYFFEEDGLALNSCWAIAEDKNKKLWFGSYGEGISVYDGFKFRVLSEKHGLVHNQVTKLFSKGNYMYVGTSNGVSRIDINTFKIDSWSIPAEEELFRITGFFEYKRKVYLASYKAGIYKFTEEKNNTQLVKLNAHKNIYAVFKDKDSIYSSNQGFFTKNNLADYVNGKDTLSADKAGTSIIWDYVKTKDDQVFAAAWGIYDTNGGIYEIQDDAFMSRASEFNIPSKEVISLAYDPDFEKLYAGTRDAGLFEIALKPQIKFHEIEEKNVLGFARTDGTSAVLMNDAIILKNAENEHRLGLSQLKQWQENYVRNTNIPLPKHADDFYELDYTTRAADISFYDIKVSGNVFWINTNIGVFAIKASGELKHYLPVHSEEINFTPDGHLIETNPYGGVRVYSDLDALDYIHYNQEDPQTPTMVVNSLQKDDKTYFLSVFSGLYVWKKNDFHSYLQNGIWGEKKLRHISTFGKDLAISNEFGDVFIVNDNNSFELLKKIPRAKIQGNTISFLKEYRGNLLIGTEKGLSLYNEDRYIFIDEEQGLQQPLLSAEVNKNILTIGSKDGFYNIDLDAISDTNALVKSIEIKEVFTNNAKFPSGQYIDKEDIRLPYNENTVLLKFSTNAHPYPHKLKYQYRLNASENWSLPTSKPEIFLPFLPSNDYEVDVKVLDQSTGLNYTDSLVKLSILPPYWQTWWFIALIISSILLAVYVFYKFQINQARRFEAQKRLIQKRFEETKMEALLAQMNPHFIFNAMNSIQNYIMDSDIDNASVFLGDFAKLIRLNLDHCTKPSILLVEEIEYLQSYIRVENTRFNNNIKVVMEIDPRIDTYEVEIPTMLLQSFVENVFVHAFPASIQNPTLKISFNLLTENILQCKIEDNGAGFSENSGNKLHKSRGVSLVKERLALLGYDVEETIQINSEKNKGTSVIINLKI